MLDINCKNKISESRTYVAICYRSDFSGVYFKKFTISEEDIKDLGSDVSPAWYFLNSVDFAACIEDVIPIEMYNDIRDC
jgi:hypothetical protein